jgi:hypothetical protein
MRATDDRRQANPGPLLGEPVEPVGTQQENQAGEQDDGRCLVVIADLRPEPREGGDPTHEWIAPKRDHTDFTAILAANGLVRFLERRFL